MPTKERIENYIEFQEKVKYTGDNVKFSLQNFTPENKI